MASSETPELMLARKCTPQHRRRFNRNPVGTPTAGHRDAGPAALSVIAL